MFDSLVTVRLTPHPPEGIKATARHILVKKMEDADQVQEKLYGGSSFASLGSEFSTCPSGLSEVRLAGFHQEQWSLSTKSFSLPTPSIGEVVGPFQTKVRDELLEWRS